jgi:hypothetical protein
MADPSPPPAYSTLIHRRPNLNVPENEANNATNHPPAPPAQIMATTQNMNEENGEDLRRIDARLFVLRHTIDVCLRAVLAGFVVCLVQLGSTRLPGYSKCLIHFAAFILLRAVRLMLVDEDREMDGVMELSEEEAAIIANQGVFFTLQVIEAFWSAYFACLVVWSSISMAFGN